ncbi:hypothetical protein [Rhodobacteraceae bacterium DSL-40]|uniref:hypothetical protein n=1 Tax=Amaricoccus sp. B4 TaxID=3368557 RepID=UPI0013A69032
MTQLQGPAGEAVARGTPPGALFWPVGAIEAEAIEGVASRLRGPRDLLCILRNTTEYDIEVDWHLGHGRYEGRAGDIVLPARGLAATRPAALYAPGFAAGDGGCNVVLVISPRRTGCRMERRFGLLVATPPGPDGAADHLGFSPLDPATVEPKRALFALNAVTERHRRAAGVFSARLGPSCRMIAVLEGLAPVRCWVHFLP